MKDQVVRRAAEISLVAFSLYAGVRGLVRRMLSSAGRPGIVDFPSAVGAGQPHLVPCAEPHEKAPGVMSRPLRGRREDRGKAIAAVPPAAEASRTKAVEPCDAVRRFAPDVRETEPETSADAEELREARVTERGSPRLSEPVRASVERARRRRSGRRRARVSRIAFVPRAAQSPTSPASCSPPSAELT